MSEPLVDDQARAVIGTVVASASGTVVKKDFQRWAAAVGDRNPLYFDDETARAHGYREVIAPPMYLQHVTLGVIDLDELRSDGIPARSGSAAHIPLPKCPRWMAGGEQTSFHEPVYDGDRITSTRTITNIEEKHGRSGPFVLITASIRYERDNDHALVAESTVTTIARP